jgi:very-short-patch-repair endonuclease
VVDLLDPVTALQRWGGVADGTTLRRTCGAPALRLAVTAGRIRSLGRNSYALPGADEALATAVRLGGTVSHLSAAQAWGWRIKTVPQQPQVTVPRKRNVETSRRAGVRLHWTDLRPEDLAGRCTSRLRTVVDCARTLAFDEALAVADSALREGYVTPQQLEDAARCSPRTGRARVVRVVTAADGRADNPFESCLRAIALEVEGWAPRAQAAVPGVGRADVGDPDLRVVLEAESYEFHALPEAFSYDLRRYSAMVRAGWVVLRFGWDDVMHRPDAVRSTIRDVVRRQQQAVRQCPRCVTA